MPLTFAHMEVSEELKLLATAFDAHQPIAILDRNGTFIRTNQAFCELTGYSPHQLRGMNVRLLRSQQQNDRFYREMWLSLYDKGYWQGELWNRLKDGEGRHHVNITAVRDDLGHFTHYVAFYEDLSEQYHQQQLLEQKARQESTLSTLLTLCLEETSVEDFLNHCQRQLELTCLWNWKQLHLCQSSPSGLQTLIEHGTCHNDTCIKAPMTLRLCKQVLEQKIPRELTLNQSTSEHSPIENDYTLYAIPLQQHTQHCVLLLTLPTPVIQSPQQKDFIHRVVHILGMGINKRATEQALIEARNKAEKANKAKSQLLSSVSHELRTPLNAILGFSQLLLSDELTDEQKENTAEIQASGQHLLMLINDILDLARMESGRIQLQTESFYPGRVIDESVALIRQLAAEKNITIQTHFNINDDTDILADAMRLKQVLVNLLSNAIKYNVQGGQIHLCLSLCNDDFISISIEDTGIGIAPQYREQMFQIFNRLGAENSEIEGSGIGLAICKRLMEMMHGQISYAPGEQQGSVFRIDLPVAIPNREHTPQGKRFNILCIDQDTMHQQQIRNMLCQRNDIRLFIEGNASYGVDLALKHHIDLIVLNATLPDLSPEEIISILKASPRTSTTPLVIVNGTENSAEISLSLRQGATEYLPGPVNLEKLLLLIEQLQMEQEQLMLTID